jgi:hypothetical protein
VDPELDLHSEILLVDLRLGEAPVAPREAIARDLGMRRQAELAADVARIRAVVDVPFPLDLHLDDEPDRLALRAREERRLRVALLLLHEGGRNEKARGEKEVQHAGEGGVQGVGCSRGAGILASTTVLRAGEAATRFLHEFGTPSCA